MPKVFTSDKQKIGKIGEDAACLFLMKHGYKILEQNYTKKWGELDIVSEKDSVLHFVEVKSVTHLPAEALGKASENGYRPEDNMHPWKLKRLGRAIQTYLLERNVPENKNWQFDVCIVYLNPMDHTAQINLLENIIL